MASPSPTQLGDAIRQAAAAAGITQRQLAEALERDQTTISAWMKGENWPQLWAIPVIEDLCGIRRGEILRAAEFVDPDDDPRVGIMADNRLALGLRQALVTLYDDLLGREGAGSISVPVPRSQARMRRSVEADRVTRGQQDDEQPEAS